MKTPKSSFLHCQVSWILWPNIIKKTKSSLYTAASVLLTAHDDALEKSASHSTSCRCARCLFLIVSFQQPFNLTLHFATAGFEGQQCPRMIRLSIIWVGIEYGQEQLRTQQYCMPLWFKSINILSYPEKNWKFDTAQRLLYNHTSTLSYF